MNSITHIPKPITLNQALSFLEGLVFEAVDEYEKQRKRFDAFDIACHVEHTAKARIVQYVRDRVDWPSIATDDALVSADDARACYEYPPKFRELVDEALFRYFQTLVEDWEYSITSILVRSGYIKADDSEPWDVEKPGGVRPYRLEKLV